MNRVSTAEKQLHQKLQRTTLRVLKDSALATGAEQQDKKQEKLRAS